MSVIDESVFNELKQISGTDFINELIDAFLEDAPNMIQNMQTAIDTKDIESFRRNAHSLKSNANTFGGNRSRCAGKGVGIHGEGEQSRNREPAGGPE